MTLTCNAVSIKVLSLCWSIDKLWLYGFGSPPYVDTNLAEQCAGYVLSN